MEAVGLAREEEARRFLELLYGGCAEGWLLISSRQSQFAAILQHNLAADGDGLGYVAAAVVAGGQAGDDVYHSVAVMRSKVPRGRGTEADTLMVPALWAELDYGVDGHTAAVAARNEAGAWDVINKLPLAPSLVVKSGGGFHLYWLLAEPLRVDGSAEMIAAVRRCNRALIRVLREAGADHVDSIVDLARVLRPAGTMNWKLGTGRPVELVSSPGHRWPWEDLWKYLAPLVPAEEVRVAPRGSEGPEDVVLVPVDGLVEGCPFLRHCRDEPAEVPEPEWHAMVSVLSRVRGGSELAHEWSRGHPGYSAAETAEKLRAAGKPMRCDTIAERSGGKWCDGCSNRGLINSPIALSRRDPGVEGMEPEAVTPASRGRGGSALLEADLKNAHRLERVYGENVFAVGTQWWTWDGTRWTRDLYNEIGQHLTHLSEIVRAEVAEMVTAGVGHEQLDAMMSVVKGVEKVAGMRNAGQAWQWVTTQHTMQELDADPLVLNAQNGTLDLRTGELREHDRAALLTRRAGAEWHGAGAECPAWLAFLKQVMPLEEGRECLQRLAGLSVSGLTDPRVLPVLHGTGFNGKTVFLENVRRVLGDYAHVAPEGFVVDRKDAVHPTSLAAMKGARMVTSSETEASSVLAAAFVKMITGGEEVNARFMHKDEFRYKPEFTMWMATNNQPRVKDAGDAIWERLVLVPFEVVVGVEERVERSVLDARFEGEAAGILAWCVRGLWDLRREGLRIPLEWQLARAAYRAEEDLFGLFLEESCVVGSGERVTLKDLVLVYRWWCEERNERTWSANAVGRELTNRGFKQIRVVNGRGREGLKLRDDLQVRASQGF